MIDKPVKSFFCCELNKLLVLKMQRNRASAAILIRQPTVHTQHSLLHKRVWQIVCDGIKEGGGKLPREGGDRIEKFHVTLLQHNPSLHMYCDAYNVSQTVWDAIHPKGGDSIEKCQHHPPDYFSWLFHPESCHVIQIHIRSRERTFPNAKHSLVNLICLRYTYVKPLC